MSIESKVFLDAEIVWPIVVEISFHVGLLQRGKHKY